MDIEDTVYIKTFDHILSVSYDHIAVKSLISTIYSHLLSDRTENATIEYRVSYQPDDSRYTLCRKGIQDLSTQSQSDLIYYFEKDFTIELQKIIKDKLFFIHGAVLSKNDHSLVISGRSGAGKSTTTLAMLNYGFNYVSDELAPIHIETLHISPFPHAICLKSPPPWSNPFPDSTLLLDRTWHVPAHHKYDIHATPPPLSHFIFLEFNPNQAKTEFKKLNQTEAMINIYQNALNQLAHNNDGLDAAHSLSKRTESFLLKFSDLNQAIRNIDAIAR